MSSKVASELRERLAGSPDASGALQRQRLDLLRRIHRSLTELRTRRSRPPERRESSRPVAVAPVARVPADACLTATFGFTPREGQVALLLATGAGNKAIAQALRISEHTARHHTRHILLKLGVHSRARAGAVVLRALGADSVPADLP